MEVKKDAEDEDAEEAEDDVDGGMTDLSRWLSAFSWSRVWWEKVSKE